MSNVIGELTDHDRDDTLRPLDEADEALSFVLPWVVTDSDQLDGELGRQLAYAQQRVRMARNNLERTIRSYTGSDPEGGQE